MGRWNELVLDTATALLYILGSYSVYNREKEFTSPVRQPAAPVQYRALVLTRPPPSLALEPSLLTGDWSANRLTER